MKNGCLILKRSDMMKSPENGKENEQMKVEDIISHVDHTLLKAAASWEEIRILCLPSNMVSMKVCIMYLSGPLRD